MKNNHQKKSFKIDLLNLEKMSAEAMGVIRAGDDNYNEFNCWCVEKGGQVGTQTYNEMVLNPIP